MNADLLVRRQSAFVLWRVSQTAQPPVLVIGELTAGAPISLGGLRRIALKNDAANPDLWYIEAAACALNEGWIYHYWFEVTDANPNRNGLRIQVTDPAATAVNWRLAAPRPDDPHYTDDDAYPASVIKYQNGQLVPCDVGGEEPGVPAAVPLDSLSANNQLVIYELPTAWARVGSWGVWQVGVGSFCDVTALVDTNAAGSNFSDLAVVQKGRSYLTELGITALELLPPADSFYKRQWGYDTSNFLSPDAELGDPITYSWSVANRDLQTLTAACHAYGIRFFIDSVMAFAKQHAYQAAATNDFFILDPAATPDDPDAHTSRGTGPDNLRNGYGSDLFRYSTPVVSYDPVTGGRELLYPARQLMKTAVIRWINDFGIDGIRMDSIENVASWDFVEEYKNTARQAWQDRYPGDTSHFLVVGEELSEPMALLQQGRLDGIWHESFKIYVRYAITGQSAPAESSFESTVRRMMDCRSFGFTDMAQAIIYLTSHDVEGYRNERLYNFLNNNGITDTEPRIKLAFVCLLTAVGIPMILAGEEFADQHDLFDKNGDVDQQGGKQVDPVNYSRLSDPWRNSIKQYVSLLTAARTNNVALSVDDTDFIHMDFNDGKRVLAWQRGVSGSGAIVIVVANFSDYGTPDPANPASQYVVNNWPAVPAGKSWYEVTQTRAVPMEWAGREPIYPWEAKVYTLQ